MTVHVPVTVSVPTPDSNPAPDPVRSFLPLGSGYPPRYDALVTVSWWDKERSFF